MINISKNTVFLLRRLLAILVLVSFVSTPFWLATPSTKTDASKLQVSASFYLIYEFTKAVGKEKIEVINLTPPGIEPHSYEPTPKQLAKLYQSDVLVYNGQGFESWIEKLLPDYSKIAIDASSDVILLPIQHDKDDDHSGHDPESAYDPHYWLDPQRAEQMVRNISKGLTQADPSNQSYYHKNANEYIAQLQKLDSQIQNSLATCKFRTIITSHGAFTYYAERYNLEVYSMTGISPEQEVSPARLRELSLLAREKSVSHVFFERYASPSLAQTLATEVGIKTMVFDPIESLNLEDQEKGKDYLSVQEENFNNLRQALACQ